MAPEAVITTHHIHTHHVVVIVVSYWQEGTQTHTGAVLMSAHRVDPKGLPTALPTALAGAIPSALYAAGAVLHLPALLPTLPVAVLGPWRIAVLAAHCVEITLPFVECVMMLLGHL